MPRYPLILRDKTYVAILKYAASKNRTFGKQVNIILDDFAKNIPVAGQVPLQRICVVCNKEASIVVHGKGQQKFYVCAAHKSLARKVGSYKEIEK